MSSTASAEPRYRVAAIPEELRAIPRWCGFQIVSQPNGKTKKLPLISGVSGKHLASCNEPSTLRPFDVALRDAEARGLYLAFAFDRDLPYFFIDADDVVGPEGVVRPDVQLVRDTLDTYTEISCSGTGLHIIGRGAFPEHSGNRPAPQGCTPLERYPLHGGRFCVFTGNVVPGYETIAERGEALGALFPAREAAYTNGSTESAGYQGPSGELSDDETRAIVSWSRPYWTDGRRHQLALHLSGYLGKQGVSRVQGAATIERCAAFDSDPGAKVNACHDTYDALEGGGSVSGWHGLIDVCGLPAEDLAPLDVVLRGFWRRAHPKEAETSTEADPPPLFPIEILPEGMRAYVEAAAQSMPVPVEMIAVPMLGMIGALIGNRSHLAIKSSWHEHPTLYIVVVAEPGRMKSPALEKAFWPTDALQGDAKEQYVREKRTYDEALSRHKAKPAKERGDEPRAPRMRDYFTNDSTMEKMVDMLDASPGILIFSDELSGWIERMNQYRKGGDREHYLSIWSGKSVKVDRKSSGSVFVRRPVISVVGGIQPQIVPRLHNEANVRDGFVERILPFIPDLPVKKFNRNTIDSARFADIAELYRAIDAALPMRGDGEGVCVNLSRKAEDTFAEWADETNALAAEIGGVLGGFYTKLEAHCARFAHILHVLHHPHDCRPMVSEETMHDAIALAEWFRAQIDVFVPMLAIGLAPSGRSAGLWSRIVRQMRKFESSNSNGWVSKSELLRGLGNVKTEELTNKLDTHIDLKDLEYRHIPGGQKGVDQYRLTQEENLAESDTPVRTFEFSNFEVPWEDS